MKKVLIALLLATSLTAGTRTFFTESQILNKVYRDENGNALAVTDHRTGAQILNMVYNSTNAALNVTISTPSAITVTSMTVQELLSVSSITATGKIELTNPLSKLNLPQKNDASTPTLNFGDGDTGIYESSDDALKITLNGNSWYLITASLIGSINNDGFGCQSTSASSTFPSLVPDRSDTNTGMGQAAADQLSLIAGGMESQRITSSSTTVKGNLVVGESGSSKDLILYDVNASTQAYKIEVIDGVLTVTKIE